jgi:hypothetical protein
MLYACGPRLAATHAEPPELTDSQATPMPPGNATRRSPSGCTAPASLQPRPAVSARLIQGAREAYLIIVGRELLRSGQMSPINYNQA